MKKVKIYIPTKTAMQSAKGNQRKWVLQFASKDPKINPLMGWESSMDTLDEIRIEFENKEQAITYAKNNNFEYEVIEPNKRKFVIKSYADNFTK